VSIIAENQAGFAHGGPSPLSFYAHTCRSHLAFAISAALDRNKPNGTNNKQQQAFSSLFSLKKTSPTQKTADDGGRKPHMRTKKREWREREMRERGECEMEPWHTPHRGA
jgi:hypothetical protein